MAPDGPPDVAERITALVAAAEHGDDTAIERLVPLVYDELRGIARRQLGRLPPGQTLQATALVHEAWQKLVRGSDRWESKEHFFGAAARAMRNVLVDEARRKLGKKRGGDRRRVTLDEGCAVVGHEPREDILALDEALSKLERHDARKARVVMLRYFAGLTLDETAQAMQLGVATVERDWAYARSWLYRELTREPS